MENVPPPSRCPDKEQVVCPPSRCPDKGQVVCPPRDAPTLDSLGCSQSQVNLCVDNPEFLKHTHRFNVKCGVLPLIHTSPNTNKTVPSKKLTVSHKYTLIKTGHASVTFSAGVRSTQPTYHHYRDSEPN